MTISKNVYIKSFVMAISLITLIYISMLSSSCGGGSCNCENTSIQIKYSGFNNPWVPSDCFMGKVPCNSFQYAYWNVFYSTGSTNRNTSFNNPQYEMPCKLPLSGCFLTESETNIEINRMDYCYDLDGSRSQQVIYCYDKFVVSPPPCGKTKIVERNKLNCICATI